MPLAAAIDAGSNAIRLTIASISDRRSVRILEYLREPVRLGQDVFSRGAISPATMHHATETFVRFKTALDRYKIAGMRAVGTSAIREAPNRHEFVARVAMASGIEIGIIGGEEEARLVCRAVGSKINLRGRNAVQIDVGGGSAEVTLLEDGRISSSESFKMGGVRLLHLFGMENRDTTSFIRLTRRYLEPTRRFIMTEIGARRPGLCIGTGGSIEALGDLRRMLFGRRSGEFLLRDELEQILKRLQRMSVGERVSRLNLRPDRADVILPVAIVVEYLLKLVGLPRLHIPRVGLRDGLLIEIAEELFGCDASRIRNQVLQSVRFIGRKFDFDEAHAENVASFSEEIFDATRRAHGLGGSDRLLLMVAAWLHDIGQFLSINEHHKHSLYIINALPIVGLTPAQKRIVANLARYHHKSFPKLRHEPFAALSREDRNRVRKLSAILRLADAADFEHVGRSAGLKACMARGELTIRLDGGGGASLAKWAVERHARLFEEVFRMKVRVQ